MNIVEIINNQFLTQLFPYGLDEPVLIGQISFDMEGRLSLNIHTKQKPSVEVGKWGMWGKNYNVIMITLNGLCRDSAILTNWKNFDYAHLTILDDTDKFKIVQVGSDWGIELEFDGFIFQGCSTYTD